MMACMPGVCTRHPVANTPIFAKTASSTVYVCLPQAQTYASLLTLLMSTPLPQVCSEYHYLVLYADRLVAVNQVSGKVVSEVNWGPGVHSSGLLGEWQCTSSEVKQTQQRQQGIVHAHAAVAVLRPLAGTCPAQQ